MGSQGLSESAREPGLDWQRARARSWLRACEIQVLTEGVRELGPHWERARASYWLRACEIQVLTEGVRELDLHWERPRARCWLRASESQVLTESLREPGVEWERARARSWLSVRGFIEFPASGFRDRNFYGKRRLWLSGWRTGSYFGGFLFMSHLSDRMLYRGIPWLSSPPSGKYQSRTSSDIMDDLFHILSNSSFSQ